MRCGLPERNRLPIVSLMMTAGAPFLFGADLFREGTSGRLLQRANCPLETTIDSLTCSGNTVQNGSCREPSHTISPQRLNLRFL